jgi:cyanate lyase
LPRSSHFSPPAYLDLGLLPRQAVVADLVYAPLAATLLKAPRRAICAPPTDSPCCCTTPVRGFALWFGRTPVVTPELRALLEAGPPRMSRHDSAWHGNCSLGSVRRRSEVIMMRAELTEKMLGIKREKQWSWKQICGEIGGMSPMLIVGAVLGQMKLTKPQAAKAAELFGLSTAEQALLNEVPHRGTPMPPTDPLIYRFYELVMVNGPALKALIEEEFGDGIMSAIDFDLQLERQADPKGDRVKITMSGKFLPYKYYGATGNVPGYGYKEE